MLAKLIDGMNDGARHSAGPARPACGARPATAARATATARTSRRCLSIIEMCWGDVGLTLAIPGQGLGNSRDRLGRRRRAARALRRPLGRDGDHRAGGRLGLAPRSARPRSSTATSTSSTARRSTSPPASAPSSSSSGRRSTATRAARRSSRSSSSARNPGHEARPPRAQARDPRVGHGRVPPRGLPRARRRTCSAPRRSTRRSRSPARCRRSTTRGRSWPRWRSASRGPAWTTRARSSRTAGVEVDPLRPRYAQSGGRRAVPGARGRLRGRAAADAAGGVDGRQRQAQLAAGLDGQGEGRTHGRRRRARLRRARAAPPATTRASCWRSGRAT